MSATPEVATKLTAGHIQPNKMHRAAEDIVMRLGLLPVAPIWCVVYHSCARFIAAEMVRILGQDVALFIHLSHLIMYAV
jgi:hypothetical protein